MPYKGFISYSHEADDRHAPAIRSALHKFAKPFNRIRAVHIFRDVSDLSANPALWSGIVRALNDSEFFILLASPKSAKSKWVRKEIDHWLKIHNGKVDKLLIVLTDGKIGWDNKGGDFDWEITTALPDLLDWRELGESAVVDCLSKKFAEEPKYLDFGWIKEEEDISLRNPRFLNGIADLAATLHGRPRSDMIGEDVKAHSRYKKVRSGAILVLLLFAILAGGFALYANQQRLTAEERKDEAERQTGIANEQREIAQRQTVEAAEQRHFAQVETEKTKIAASEEEKAKNIAEERRKEAEKQTGIANERRKEAEIATEKERVATQKALEELNRSQHLLYASDMKYADALYANGDIETFTGILDQYGNAGVNHGGREGLNAISNSQPQISPVSPAFEWNYLRELTAHLVKFEKIPNFIPKHIEYSHSGKYMLSGGQYGTGIEDGLVWAVWDSKTGEMVQTFSDPEDGGLRKISFSENENWLVSISNKRGLRVWETREWKEVPVQFSPYKLDSTTYEGFRLFTFTSDDTLMTVSRYDGSEWGYITRRWKLNSSKLVPEPVQIEFGKQMYVFAISPDGRYAFLKNTGDDGQERLSLINIEMDQNGKEREVTLEERKMWTSVMVSKDGKVFAVTEVDQSLQNHKITVWNTESLKKINELNGIHLSTHVYGPDGVFSSNDKLFAMTTKDNVLIWNVEDNKVKTFPVGYLTPDNPLAFSPDDKQIAIGGSLSKNNTIQMVDLWPRNIDFDYNGERFLALTPDKIGVLTVNNGGLLSLWNLQNRRPLKKSDLLAKTMKAEFSPDGSYFFVKGNSSGGSLTPDFSDRKSQILGFWDSKNLKEVFLKDIDQCDVHKMMSGEPFSPHRRLFAQVCLQENGHHAVIWDLETGFKIFDVAIEHSSDEEASESYYSVKFSEDENRLLILKRTRKGWLPQFWDIGKEKKIAPFLDFSQEKFIDFHPKGNWLITQRENKISVRKIFSGQPKVYLAWDTGKKPVTGPLRILGTTNSKSAIGIAGGVLLIDHKTDQVIFWSIQNRKESDDRFTPDVLIASPLLDLVLEGKIMDNDKFNLWDVKTRKKKLTIDLQTQRQRLTFWEFSPDETRLATAYTDGTVKFWDLVTGQVVLSINSGQKDLRRIILSDDNRHLFTITEQGNIKLWNTRAKDPGN